MVRPHFHSRPIRLLASVLCLIALLASSTAEAKRSVAELAAKLRNASDFRVRVQAALALGASKSDEAVAPLCDGLEDTNATVRSAAAAGLGRLRKTDGLGCLEKRAKSESNGSVKSQIKRSIEQIKAGGTTTLTRAPNGSSKYYVAVAQTKNKGGRNASEIDAIVQTAVRRALLANGAMAVAPPGETAAQAQAVLDKHKLRGYLLKPTVEAPVYADSKLTIRVRLTMFTYPNQALQGEFAPKLTQSGTPSEDIDSENELIKMAAERAVAKFITVAETTRH
ncbi:MAG: HEAT repeat domain-containing protein [Myxococcota bacterium]